MKDAEPVTCSFCGGQFEKGPGPNVKPEWYRKRCVRCGTISYITMPDPKSLDSIYSSAWESPETTGRFAAGSTDAVISRSLLKAIRWNATKGSCLDYGAGRGVLTQTIADLGGRVVAVEPHGGHNSASAGTHHAVSWFDSLDDVPPDQKFEYIFCVEVIEHLFDPVEVLAGLREGLLGGGGRLVITTPNAQGWRARKEGFKWREAQNPTHLTLFTEMSLRVCLEKAGYTKIKRIRWPVDYGKSGKVARLALSFTQVIGIDGGLRLVAYT